jgi:GNAT superfamily N-acetyltransferase
MPSRVKERAASGNALTFRLQTPGSSPSGIGRRSVSRASSPWVVRPPKAQDHGKIAKLACQLGYPSTPDEIRARIERARRRAQSAVLVAEGPDGEVVGWVGVYVFRSVETDPYVEISGLVVDENVRSRGIGRVLLQAADEWALGQGCDEIAVHSNVIRKRAHAFYEQNGYLLRKTQAVLHKRLLSPLSRGGRAKTRRRR